MRTVHGLENGGKEMPDRQEAPPTRLAELVGLRRPTLRAIAREAGVSPSYLSQVASGYASPSQKVREAAVRVLGRPVEEIFPEWAARLEQEQKGTEQ
jgi:transcriptional regulator with XRE-family HTH domain